MESLSISRMPTKTLRSPKKQITAKSSFNPIQPILKTLFTRKHALTTPEESTTTTSTPNLPRRKQSKLLETIFKPLDDYICSLMEYSSSLPKFINSKRVLTDNLAPVDELPPTVCEVVEGSLPPCLDGGTYIQNGPNPQFMPRGPYHLVDGDGMVHTIKISNGKATFCSRYIKTYKYEIERGLGYPVFPNIFSTFNSRFSAYMALIGARIVTGQFNPITNGLGAANTSVALIGGSLHALCESDLPYAIKMKPDGDIVTIGRHDFRSTSKFMTMTAHPKVDPETGETFAFRFHVIPPFLTFFRIDPDGTKQRDVPIWSMNHATFVHDFAVSKNYAVFPDTQITLNLLDIMRGGTIMRVDSDKTPRLGVIRRYAEDESDMQWIDTPGLNVLHVVNSWEEGEETIVMLASNVLSIEHALERMHLVHFSLEKITIDVKAGKVVKRFPLSPQSMDFGVINPQYSGKKNRYIYAAPVETMPKMIGMVKIDLSLLGDCTVARRHDGPGCYGSEPIFVPREPNNVAAEEDDGYLLSYVYNENTKESDFLVMDAKSPDLEVVARVKLPRRVPHGFHSIFVRESDLRC